jgi:hypothetical protein
MDEIGEHVERVEQEMRSYLRLQRLNLRARRRFPQFVLTDELPAFRFLPNHAFVLRSQLQCRRLAEPKLPAHVGPAVRSRSDRQPDGLRSRNLERQRGIQPRVTVKGCPLGFHIRRYRV